MSIRREPVYISTEVWKACWLIARAKTETRPNVVTTDEMIDTLLREAIAEKCPELSDHKRDVDELDKKVIATLAAKFRSASEE
jgi:hypothetical protein